MAPSSHPSRTEERDMRDTYIVKHENDTGPCDEGFWEWWFVVDRNTDEVICKCDHQKDAERIASLLNGHGRSP